MASGKIVTNLSQVAEHLGEIAGTVEGMGDPDYIDIIIGLAHNKTSRVFDQTAATAAKTGSVSHMFEYGVAGVTQGPTRIGSPTSPMARLYVHRLTGSKGMRSVTFDYVPAKQPNPRHTVRSTGVPSKYLRLLSQRKHVFKWKAPVIERGQQVQIGNKKGNLLFVPFRSETSINNDRDKRGYMMWNTERHGKLRVTPGRRNRGNFSALWKTWWEGEGIALIQKSAGREIDLDIKKSKATDSLVGKAMKPPRASLPSSAFKKSKQKQKKSFVNSKSTRKALWSNYDGA